MVLICWLVFIVQTPKAGLVRLRSLKALKSLGCHEALTSGCSFELGVGMGQFFLTAIQLL